MKKRVWIYIVLSVVLVVALPFLIDWLIIGNNVPSNISNSDWVGFLGGYVGAIIGCVISLAGILWTINFTREQNRTDRELQIRPYFDIRYIPSINRLTNKTSWLGYVMINEWDENDTDNQETERGLLYIKNVGNGPATNIDIAVTVENIKVRYKAKFNNHNTKVTSNSVIQGGESAVSIIITNNRVAPSKEDLIWDEEGFASYNSAKFQIPSSYNFRIILRYNDLLGNMFSQELKFDVHYEMGYDRNNGGHYHCNLHLKEIGVPEKESLKLNR